MFSMSFGLMSARRLTVWSWLDDVEPLDREIDARPPGDRRVRDDDAVDDVERIALAENRRGAADLDLHAAARNAAVLEDRRADDLAGEVAFDRLRRHLRQLFGRHRRDRRRGVALVDRRRLTGDRHAFELEHVLVEREVGGRLTRGELHRARA